MYCIALYYVIIIVKSLQCHIDIFCVGQYIAVYYVYCVNQEVDHWNVNADKLLFVYENLCQLTLLLF